MDKLIENDPELSRFIMEMEQSARLKKTTEKLTHECWDLCVTNPNVSKFDSRTESCLANCVERFIDTSTFIVESFSKLAQQHQHSSPSSFSSEPSFSSVGSGFSSSGSVFSEPEMVLEDAKPTETKKKGWW